jgi:hypothetical protein
LDSQLKIFEATIDDRDHVVITRQLPGITISIVSREVVAEKADLKQVTNSILILGPEILPESDYKAIDTIIISVGVTGRNTKNQVSYKDNSGRAIPKRGLLDPRHIWGMG